jgi:CRISPR-associated protein Csm5
MDIKTSILKIKTITPVSVGTGEVWSPITDFFVDGKFIYLVNKDKLQKLLAQKSKINCFIEYVSKSINESHTGTNADLKGFIENVLKIDSGELIEQRISFPNANKSKSQIFRCFTSNGNPVIPGSSLKGAIKTALFYDWLKKSDEGKIALSQMIHNLYPHNNRNWFNKGYTKEVEEKFLNKKDKFGRPIFSNLSISDTQPFPAETLTVYDTRRIHLTNSKKHNVPQVKLCIEKIHSSAFSFKSEHWPFNEAFIKKMNNFAYYTILTEQKILNRKSKGVSDELKNKLNDFYDELTDQIDEIENTGSLDFYLRVGSGKSYFDNTIGNAIYEENENAFKSLCKMYKLGKAPNEKNYKLKEPFPVTRTVVSGLLLPMGWVKVTLKS